MRAIVVDIEDRHAAVMTENGEIIKVKNKNYEIGQSILIGSDGCSSKRSSVSGRIRRISSVAAAVALMAVTGTAAAYSLPYGTVSLDTVPSVQYTINRFDYVLEVNVDESTGTALDEVDLSSLRNQKIDKALENTIEQMDISGSTYEPESITISADTRSASHTETLKKGLEDSVNNYLGSKEQIPMTEKTAIDENGAPLTDKMPDNSFSGDGKGLDQGQQNLTEEPVIDENRPEDIPENNSPGNFGPAENEGGGVPFLIHE